MSLATEITVRYRAPGHVRFEIPEAICSPRIQQQIAAGLTQSEGIYRADFYPRQRKLSIRFLESICDFKTLSRRLIALLGEIDMSVPAPSCCAQNAQAVTPLNQDSGFGPMRWIRQQISRGQQTAAAMGIVARRADGSGVTLPWFKESTVIEFLNDALVLFLIKLHWQMITQQWLRQPWRYRYEWLASFYLIYLLVRSRHPKKG